jgi:hypothetical protein
MAWTFWLYVEFPESITMIIKSSIFSGLSVDYTQISFPSNQQTHRYLDELLKSPVDGRTEIRDTLVKLNSGHGTLADAFRSEFKFLYRKVSDVLKSRIQRWTYLVNVLVGTASTESVETKLLMCVSLPTHS